MKPFVPSERTKLDAGMPPGFSERFGSIMFGPQAAPAIPQLAPQMGERDSRELLVPMPSAGSYRSEFRSALEESIASAFSPSVLELGKIQGLMQQAPMQPDNVFARLLDGA